MTERFRGKYKIVIDDLEESEAKEIAKFILDAQENGDIDYPIQDCVSIEGPKGNVEIDE